MPDDDITWTWREGIRVGRNKMRDDLVRWAQEQRRLVDYELDDKVRESQARVWDAVLDKLIFKQGS